MPRGGDGARGMVVAVSWSMTDSLHFRAIVAGAACVLAVSLASSCASRPSRVATTEVVTTTERHVVAPPRMIDVSIVNLHDEPTYDRGTEKVVGTLVNDGDRAVGRVAIRVNALDADGAVVRSVTTETIATTIDPNGGHATFEAIMPADPEVVGYRAVAIAQ